jgi:hypothetical protein
MVRWVPGSLMNFVPHHDRVALDVLDLVVARTALFDDRDVALVARDLEALHDRVGQIAVAVGRDLGDGAEQILV